jgi:Radical SAM superfamily
MKILLLTPPFTQLNTPYPATAYLKGFLNTKDIASLQCDLGMEVILDLFSQKGLTQLFAKIEAKSKKLSENSCRILALQDDYIQTIAPLISFLQHKNPTLVHAICDRTYLPEAARFQTLEDLEWAFGTMGLQDKARHLATLYLEDLSDLIQEAIDPHFGFSRYAERLGRAASSFEGIEKELQQENSLISRILIRILAEKIATFQPDVVCLSVPFPGNLFGAFKCGQFIKQQYPNIAIIMGGGYPNTELRSVSDPKVFDYIDYICLDDGETPLDILLQFIEGKKEISDLKRVFLRKNGLVAYCNDSKVKDLPQKDTGTPDYSDLPLKDYLSVIEIINPMHRLWSDGRWNKLTLAHGCYWGKCSFCDISLDYIQRYEPLTAVLLCDRMEEIIAQTQENGFHFVDEAAPPALMREVALEILRRKLTVVWWTNIRFEKSFTPDLCRLLKASGCIAVSGGLEVASDRLLEKMEKGVTVAQVARVADNFTAAGIMVHAYLMYGFPTQTEHETIDSLEMVRQLFLNGVIQSGFWHQFAMTAHSPVGLNPEKYGVIRTGSQFAGFAENDLFHSDPKGCEHEQFSAGLKKSLFNYMHGIGFDYPLSDWFDFKTPRTKIPPKFIENSINEETEIEPRSNAIVLWLGNLPTFSQAPQGKKQLSKLIFYDKKEKWTLDTTTPIAQFLQDIFPKIHLPSPIAYPFQQFKKDFSAQNLGDVEVFIASEVFEELRMKGLLIV